MLVCFLKLAEVDGRRYAANETDEIDDERALVLKTEGIVRILPQATLGTPEKESTDTMPASQKGSAVRRRRSRG